MIKHIYTSFDFGKLSRALDAITKDTVDKSKHAYAEMTAKNITDALRPLRPLSIEMRKKGHYWGGKKVAPTSSTKPLVYTGRLLESIKMVDDGMEMMEYGIHHHKGFDIPRKKAGIEWNQKVNPRPFLAVKGKNIKGTKYGKQQEKYTSEMFKKIAQILRSPKTYRF